MSCTCHDPAVFGHLCQARIGYTTLGVTGVETLGNSYENMTEIAFQTAQNWRELIKITGYQVELRRTSEN